MKKLLKYIIPILIFLAFTTPAFGEWWAKNASHSLLTNDGTGLANADIHVRNCYIGLGVTPCGSVGGGSVTSFSFTDGNGFDGTVTNPTTTPTLSLTTQLIATRVPFIGSAGALTSSSSFNYLTSGSYNKLVLGTDLSQNDILSVHKNGLAQSVSGAVIRAVDNGTYNGFSTAVTKGGSFQAIGTRISGAQPLTNIGIEAIATGGDNNYAGIFTGNVGIGVTSPITTLDVGGTFQQTDTFLLGSNTLTSIFGDNTLLALGDTQASGSSTVFTIDDGNTIAYLDNSAHGTKLGVNNSVPTSSLDVVGTLGLKTQVQVSIVGSYVMGDNPGFSYKFDFQSIAADGIVEMPSANDVPGRIYSITRTSGTSIFSLLITPNAPSLIEDTAGAFNATYALPPLGKAMWISDGTDWRMIMSN